MAYLGKNYIFYKQENFEDFLKHVGVPQDKLQASSSSVSEQKLVKNGDKYTNIMKSPAGQKEITFTSGVEFDDVIGSDNIPVKTTIVVDGNTVTQTLKSDKGTTTFKKEYNGDELVVTVTTDGWGGVAKRYYKA